MNSIILGGKIAREERRDWILFVRVIRGILEISWDEIFQSMPISPLFSKISKNNEFFSNFL